MFTPAITITYQDIFLLLTVWVSVAMASQTKNLLR